MFLIHILYSSDFFFLKVKHNISQQWILPFFKNNKKRLNNNHHLLGIPIDSGHILCNTRKRSLFLWKTLSGKVHWSWTAFSPKDCNPWVKLVFYSKSAIHLTKVHLLLTPVKMERKSPRLFSSYLKQIPKMSRVTPC